MPFEPADGEAARWRRVDEYIDKKKDPGELVTFQERRSWPASSTRCARSAQWW